MSNPNASTVTYAERKGGAYVRDTPDGEIRKIEPEPPQTPAEEPTTDPEPSDEDGNE
jgi:hypothetical protein